MMRGVWLILYFLKYGKKRFGEEIALTFLVFDALRTRQHYQIEVRVKKLIIELNASKRTKSNLYADGDGVVLLRLLDLAITVIRLLLVNGTLTTNPICINPR